MRSVISFCVDRSFVVNIVSIFIILFGALSFFHLKRDLIPAVQFNIITIQSTLSGASALEIERYVTFPIEEAVHGLPGTIKLSSSSRNNISTVTIQFEVNKEDIDETVEDIKSRIEQIRSRLPEKISEIKVKQQRVDSFEFLRVTVAGVDKLSDTDRAFIELIRTKLQQVIGIVKVDNSMPARHLHVEFNEESLARSGYDINYARNKLTEYFTYTPIGTIHKDESTVSIDLKTGMDSLEDVRGLPLYGNESGRYTRLSDVATVEFRNAVEEESFLLNGESSVDLVIHKDTESDAIILRESVAAVLEEIDANRPSHLSVRITADSPAFIERQLNVLKANALSGIVLVCIILYFLLGPKIALMTALGMPLAYFGTFLVLSQLGISFDLISLIGMIIVVGMLVDDAIIVSESYTQLLEQGLEPREAAIESAARTILPVTGTILTTIVAFAPILIVKSEIGKILYAIPVVIISALVISWFESFFVLPNHLSKHAGKLSASKGASKFNKIRTVYEKVLTATLRFRYLVLVGLVAFFIGSIVLAAKLPKKFDLKIAQTNVQVTAILTESVSLAKTEAALIPLLKHIDAQQFEHVDYISTRLGSAWVNDELRSGFRYATINVFVNQHISKPAHTQAELAKQIDTLVRDWKADDFELLSTEVKTSNNQNLNSDSISIYVSGGDKVAFEVLQEEVNNIATRVESVESLDVDSDRYQTSWQFNVNKPEAMRYGFSPSQIALQLSEFFSAQELVNYRYNGESIKIFTEYKELDAINIEALDNLKLVSAKSLLVPVAKLGEWKQVRILKDIQHEDLHRKFKLNAIIDDSAVSREEIIARLDKEMDALRDKYPSYQFVVERLSEDEQRSRSYAMKVGVLTVGLVLLILSLVLGSLTQPLLVSLAIPFGFSGIVYAVWLHGYNVDLMMFIGLIGMAGVVVNDSLIMIDSINKNMDGAAKTKSAGTLAIVNGASSRLRSIILTTLTTLGGLFPMAYGLGGESGFTAPLAFAMGWGLLSATVLTLFVLPALLSIRLDFFNLFRRAEAP